MNTEKTRYTLATIRDTAIHCKEEGIPISEYRLRILVSEGKIPHIAFGRKQMINFKHVLEYIDGCC